MLFILVVYIFQRFNKIFRIFSKTVLRFSSQSINSQFCPKSFSYYCFPPYLSEGCSLWCLSLCLQCLQCLQRLRCLLLASHNYSSAYCSHKRSDIPPHINSIANIFHHFFSYTHFSLSSYYTNKTNEEDKMLRYTQKILSLFSEWG